MAEKVLLHLSEVLSLTAVFISSAYLITDSSWNPPLLLSQSHDLSLLLQLFLKITVYELVKALHAALVVYFCSKSVGGKKNS